MPEVSRRRAGLSRLSGRGGLLAGGCGVVLAALYLAQNLTLPPDQADGGVGVDRIHAMSEGALPFWDFVDFYGPLAWPIPVLAYRLGGQQVWATNVAVLLIRLLSIVLAYRLVARLAGRLPAWLAALMLTVLLGAPWLLLQTPYPMHSALALVLAVWLLLLAPSKSADGAEAPASPSLARVATAGILTGVLIWMKLNAGAFLLAGGLFYCFYWLPVAREPRGPRAPAWLRAAWYAGLVAYAAVFLLFIRRGWAQLFFFYLVAPLVVALVATFREVWVRPADRAAALQRLRLWGVFLASTLAVVVGVFLGYFGVDGGIAYVRETAAIFARLRYDAPFPPLGEPGSFLGFNEHYWPQLPWLVSLSFVAAVGVAQLRARQGKAGRGVPHPVLVGLFVLFTLVAFIIYSRADEGHLAQAVWPAVPVLFVMLGSIRNELGRPLWLSLGLSAATLAVVAPMLAFRPEGFRWGPGEWNSPHLRHLTFAAEHNPYVRDGSPHITDHDWNVASDSAARYVDRLTPDGSEILNTLRNEMLHFNSNTRAVGGRYRFLFYMLKNRLIGAEDFREVVPDDVIRKLVNDPPRVIVHGYGPPGELFKALPELYERFRRDYELREHYAHILIYERREPSPD